MFRIESHNRFVNEPVRLGRPMTVNNVPFRDIEGRVLSDPITERQTGMFAGVRGYALVRAEAPYEIIKALDPGIALFLTSEGEPATSEADAHTAPDAPDSEREPPPPARQHDGGDGEPALTGGDGDDREPPPPPREDDGLNALTKAELTERLEALGRTVGSRATKDDMLAVLRGIPTDE